MRALSEIIDPADGFVMPKGFGSYSIPLFQHKGTALPRRSRIDRRFQPIEVRPACCPDASGNFSGIMAHKWEPILRLILIDVKAADNAGHVEVSTCVKGSGY
jgi:hypothetical protein